MRRVLLLAVLVLVAPGCAWTNRQNLVLFDAFERALVPDAGEQTAAHVAVAPLTYPAGLAALALDTVVVHPAMVVDDAWTDTTDICWTSPDWDAHYVTELALLPVRCVGTPLVWLTAFLARSAFDVPVRETPAALAERREALARLTDEVRAKIAAGDLRGALARIDAEREARSKTEGWDRLERLALMAVVGAGADDAFVERWRNAAGLDALGGPEREALAGYLRRAPLAAREVVAGDLARCPTPPRFELAAVLLADPDPVIRWRALRALRHGDPPPARLLAPLTEDPSPSIRALAERLRARAGRE